MISVLSFNSRDSLGVIRLVSFCPGVLPLADPEIPDARASGRKIPIPAKSGFPISRIRDSGQIGIPDFPNPGFRPNRDARFPEIRDSGQIGIQIRENPDFFFAAARTVIAHCQRQARLLRFLVGVPGWEKRLIVQ